MGTCETGTTQSKLASGVGRMRMHLLCSLLSYKTSVTVGLLNYHKGLKDLSGGVTVGSVGSSG